MAGGCRSLCKKRLFYDCKNPLLILLISSTLSNEDSGDDEDDKAVNVEEECTHLIGVSSIVAVNHPDREGGPDGKRALVDISVFENCKNFLFSMVVALMMKMIKTISW